MNTVKDFTRTLHLWKNAANKKVRIVCWEVIIGFCRNKVKQNIIAVQRVYYFVGGIELFNCIIIFLQCNNSTLTELISKSQLVVASQKPYAIEKN